MGNITDLDTKFPIDVALKIPGTTSKISVLAKFRLLKRRGRIPMLLVLALLKKSVGNIRRFLSVSHSVWSVKLTWMPERIELSEMWLWYEVIWTGSFFSGEVTGLSPSLEHCWSKELCAYISQEIQLCLTGEQYLYLEAGMSCWLVQKFVMC